MKKELLIVIVCLLLISLLSAGCEPEGTYDSTGEIIMDVNGTPEVVGTFNVVPAASGFILYDSNDYSDYDITLDDYTSYANIVFSFEDKQIEFNYVDGKIDVVYDVNDLTGSAQVFCEAMEPYLNEWIKDKAKLLVGVKENE